MDESQFAVRPATASDFEALAAIQNVVWPDEPVSAETLRHEEESFGPGFFRQRFIVELRATGRAVALGGIGEDPECQRGVFWTYAMVLPDFRRRGIGARLYEMLTAEATEHRATALQAYAREEDLASRAFLQQRGFADRRRSWTSLLELEGARTEQLAELRDTLAARGILISTLAQEGPDDPAVIEQLYQLDCETSADVPRLSPFSPPPVAAYRGFFMEGPGALPDGWFIAKDRGRYVAMSYVHREPAMPDTLQQFYTCTRREYRRGGLARALKLCVIEYGKQNQYRWIQTHNDALNAPMWNLNEQLGFRRVRTGIQFEKSLSREE